MFELPDQISALITLGTLVAMFVLFVRETYTPEVTAIAGAGFLLLVGILPVDDALAVFSNPAPLTIAAMFVLSSALVRTGSLELFTRAISQGVRRHPKRMFAVFAGFTAGASAFMNNTPVVVMMMPVAVRLGKILHVPASRLLIPLSYCAILGGMLTLIGSSTNLIVDGVARANGLQPFGIFEVTPVAIVIVLAGLGFTAVAAPRLLPQRDSMVDFLSARRQLKFLTEVVVPDGSNLIGQNVLTAEPFRQDVGVVDVLRNYESLRTDLKSVVLAAGDRVVLRSSLAEVMGLRDHDALASPGELDSIGQRRTITVEALISPGCRMIGTVLSDLRLRRRYGVYLLGVHRRESRVPTTLDAIRVQVGDTMLLEGDPADIARLADEQQLAQLTRPAERPFRRRRAPIVGGILALVIVGAALNIMPIVGLALIGVALALATRCVDAEEAFEAIDGRLLALIFAMLCVGSALQSTGAVTLIVDGLVPYLSGLQPTILLLLVFLMASCLTELVSNNAVAVVVTPVAITLAEKLGVDARPFVVIVMIAASASFATPIGYQTNTLVYAPGGYRFTDFARLGVPMNLGTGVIASVLVPMYWPL
ncbi:MAG: SLC13 family permease [Pseudomonadota bacterium]